MMLNKKHFKIKFCLVLLLCLSNSYSQQLETQTLNNSFRVILPDNNNPNDFKVIEWSTNLVDWELVARNYGYNWQNTFPNTETLGNVNVGLSDYQYYEKSLDNEKVFFRLSTNSVSSLSDSHIISRFLQQATFGPTLDDINNIQNINSNIGTIPSNAALLNQPYTAFKNWISNQVDTSITPISSHRAYFRKRSNPQYVNQNSSKHGTSLYEVGHDPSIGIVFDYTESDNEFWPDQNAHGKMASTMTTQNGKVYNYIEWISGDFYGNNSQNTSYVEESRYNDWLANVDQNGNPRTYNPNDTEGIKGDAKKKIWYQLAIDAPDQLRQRMAWALSQILVVGEAGNIHPQNNEKWLKYYDIFVRNAFGNYRDILEEVTYSPHMAYYLTYEKNQKEENGIFPDENYAREVMQLFTIGLWELNNDGTFKLDNNNNLIPTYSNDEVAEFAKVFTGLDRQQNYSGTNYEAQFGRDVIQDVRIVNNWHDFSPKIDLDGNTFSNYSSIENMWGGTPNEWYLLQNQNDPENYPLIYDGNNADVRNDIDYVLDHLFNHPNTPPFIAKRLIQRFTSSNPSPTYIEDVANAFISGYDIYGNGNGGRGDLNAVIHAILLHPEARTPSLSIDNTYGKLREPLIKFISYSRSFNLTSLNTYGLYPFAYLYDKIGQEPYMYPNVFNFYRSDFQPLGEILNNNLEAPEFQPFTDVTAVGLPNCIRWLIYQGIRRDTNDTGIGQRWYSQGDLDLSYEISIAYNNDTLIDHLDLLLTAGRLTEDNRQAIKNHLQSISGNSESNREQKVKDALWLFCILPEFNSLY
ncbi:MAG: DUF1800 family protein [Verrucomicrobiota bacterium]|nr:DUF1800 family protein [Verrucomicrobiota bacterium]